MSGNQSINNLRMVSIGKFTLAKMGGFPATYGITLNDEDFSFDASLIIFN